MGTRSVIVDATQPDTGIYVQYDGLSVGAEVRRLILTHGRSETIRILRDHQPWSSVWTNVDQSVIDYAEQVPYAEYVPGFGVAILVEGEYTPPTKWRGDFWCEFEHTILTDGHVVTRSASGWRKCYDSRRPVAKLPDSYIRIAYENYTLTPKEKRERYLTEFYPDSTAA